MGAALSVGGAGLLLIHALAPLAATTASSSGSGLDAGVPGEMGVGGGGVLAAKALDVIRRLVPTLSEPPAAMDPLGFGLNLQSKEMSRRRITAARVTAALVRSCVSLCVCV